MDHGATIFLIVWLVGIFVIWPPWFWLSYRSRRTRGEPLIPRAPANALFCERSASGRAQGNILGSARNCLMVSIAGDELWITPTFPFNSIAPYGVMGLEYRVSRSRVVRAEARKNWIGSLVVIEIAPLGGAKSRTLELKLKDPEAFLKALRS
jgi:hypothetical protein